MLIICICDVCHNFSCHNLYFPFLRTIKCVVYLLLPFSSYCDPPPDQTQPQIERFKTTETEATNQLPPSTFDSTRHTFRLVEGVTPNLYVYEALWNGENIRLESIMVQDHNFTNSLFCVLYYSLDKNAPGVYVEPNVTELHTYQSLYTSAAIKCPIKANENVGKVPLFVGLVEKEYESPKLTFIVENMNETSGMSTNFTVCVPTMFEVENAAMVVEKIEMSRILGAGRVVFYNASISSDVDAVLRMYAREWAAGRETLEVVVLPWHLPLENGTALKIPYFAQQLCIDDCLHRYKRLSRYMVFTDLDEFPIPIRHDNWFDFIQKRIHLKHRNNIGWRFRSSVLSADRPSPAKGYEDAYLRYGSSIFGLTSRDVYVYPSHERSKMIVDPRTIEEMGVHHIWEGQGFTDNLGVEAGLLFHYRSTPVHPCNLQVNETRVVDRYGKRLLARLQQIWSKLDGVGLGVAPFKAADKSNCKYRRRASGA